MRLFLLARRGIGIVAVLLEPFLERAVTISCRKGFWRTRRDVPDEWSDVVELLPLARGLLWLPSGPRR